MSPRRDNGDFGLFRPVTVVRVFFILFATLMSSLLAWDTRQNSLAFSIGGMLIASTIVLIEMSLHGVNSRKIVLALCGLFIGLVCAQLVYPTLGWLLVLTVEFSYKLFNRGLQVFERPEMPRESLISAAQFLSQLTLGYFGVVTALRHSDWLRLSNLKLYMANPADRVKILDTSVIIDGRVLDLAALGFFEGQVIVPRFVLLELQSLADREDALKRARGRRGLDVLEKLKARCPQLDLSEQDFPAEPAVDAKLILLARQANGTLYTNDSSLQKIAQLQQIAVVNLHELADAMRPAVYVGELFSLRISKPGKEPDQGVGFLEDGTMVVVDGAGRHVGRDCEVIVTSLLQNTAGRMIFGRRPEEEPAARGSAA